MRRPWNTIDTAVYSMVTQIPDATNMNICTWVTAVSKHPRLYAIALENGSKTLELQHATQRAVLQILTRAQIHLVRSLGRKSGHHYDKMHYLKGMDVLGRWQGFNVIRNCSAYILLEKIRFIQAGDHHLFLYKVLRSTTREEGPVLMFQDLLKEKIIL